MARRIRFVPPSSLVEVTCRTVQGRWLLRPSPELRDIVVGILARARTRYSGVRLHAFVFLSNHFHLLATAESAQQLAGFMCYVNSNVAREAGRLYQWTDKFWGTRFQAIVVSLEEAAQVGRLRYVLSQGCKEGLVRRPAEWPGAQCIDALLEGKPLMGHWIDRTRQYEAHRRGREADDSLFASDEILSLESLPCWAHLPPEKIRAHIAALIADIERETTAALAAEGREPLGAQAVQRQDPHERPARVKRSPAPLIHAASRAVRLEFWAAYREFVRAFRCASERLRRGDLSATFPPWSFPPALPYVPDLAPT